MTHTPGCSTKFSAVALLCVSAMLLTWLAPAILLSGALSEFLQRGPGQTTNALADGPTELEDADDPIVFVADSQPADLPGTYALEADSLLDRVWFPLAPVRPPNHLNSI